MDLLYLHILDIPKNESLSGVYIIDGVTLYASTQVSDNLYKLYTVSNYKICEFLESCNSLGHLDTVVANKHWHIIEQCGHYENNIKIVNYKTDKLKDKNIKKISSERLEISRFTSNNRHRLF